MKIKKAEIYYARIEKGLTREQKLGFLEAKQHVFNVDLKRIYSDVKNNWLTDGLEADFDTFTPIASKEGKGTENQAQGVIFKTYSNGAQTNRDAWAYNFNSDELKKNMRTSIGVYNEHVFRYSDEQITQVVDDFVTYDDTKLSWCSSLKQHLAKKTVAKFKEDNIRISLYRPFTKRYLYFDKLFTHRRGQFPSIFPTSEIELENLVICCTNHDQIPFVVLITNRIPCLDVGGRAGQCFPFYIYNEDGSHRQENLTDWALKDYQAHYADEKISKWDIFYYVYGLLHHQGYRDKYAANLKRELPRIPKLKEFWKLSHAGKKLAELHLNYETKKEYPLQTQSNGQIEWRVEKMRFNKEKTAIKYNDSLTLSGIPPEALEYKLGNRSALDWIIDQYQISTDKRSGITNDPNNLDDESYIVKLIMRIVTVSVETVGLVKEISGCEL